MSPLLRTAICASGLLLPACIANRAGLLAASGDAGAGTNAAGNRCSGHGLDDEGCGCPTPGAHQPCWPGDPALRGRGDCHDGTQVCGAAGGGESFAGPTWGACQAYVVGQQCIGPCTAGEFQSCDSSALPPGVQMPALCTAGGANNEPEILVGYSPADQQTVGAGGQIKVWINDEGAPIIAPGEVIDATTGRITTAGDRTAKAGDGFLWEPALYIAPQSAENGGTPHFPTAIRGDYNNTTRKGAGSHVAGMDPAPAGSVLSERFTAEDIWDVDSLGLAPGAYIAEFVIHDGDRDRGVGCVTIVIQ